jgi:hypothetical protein
MNVARPMPTMNETGHPIWILLFLIGLIPLATITELVAAIGSKRVRPFIVDHPFAHIIWFGFIIFCISLLIPLRSGAHQPF